MIHPELLRDQGILIVTPEDPLQQADFEALAQLVDPYSESEGGLHGLLIHTESFPGWADFAAMLSHLKFVKDHHRHIAKEAAATDSGFLSVMPGIAGHFVHAQVRHFNYGDRRSNPPQQEHMMKTLKTILIPTLLGLAALSAGAAAGEEKKLTEQQAPKPVLEAFHKAYPQATDIKYEEEKEAGKTVYEVEFKDQGVKREATYAAEGTLVETEEYIKPDGLPAAVTEALKKAHPHAAVKEAEKVLKPDGSVHGYEVEIKDGKKELEIHLDAAGKILKTEAEKEKGEAE